MRPLPQFPTWPAHFIRVVATSWTPARRRQLLVALAVAPCILVVLSILLLAVLLTGPASRSANWYQQQGDKALARQDYATAQLCYASLLQTSPDDPKYRYALARCFGKLGQDKAAAALLQQLAPETAAGYLPAQLQVARDLLGGPSPSPEARRSAEARLQQILKTQPKNPDVHAMLAVLYYRTDRWDLARQHMALGGPAVDELTLPAALALSDRGDRAESEIWARRAAAHYAARLKADPTNDELRLKYAQACLLLRDFTKTLEILDAGWQQNKNPAFRKAVAHVTSLWLRESPTMAASQRLGLLQNGLAWDAQNPALLEILLDPETAVAAESVQPTTTSVQGAAVHALAQAVENCRRRQPDRVRTDLQRALSVGGPAMASIAGNVACLWAYSKAPDAASALTLSSILLDLRPTEPFAQRAQGMVLAQQEKWEQALGYLETALPAMPQDLGIHTVLATTYDKLGKPDLAEKHRKLAQPTTAPAPATSPAAVPAASKQAEGR